MAGKVLQPPRVLFVCTGNICRSPTAEGLLVHKAKAADFEVVADSAGTSDEERGNPPDPRARQVAQRRGVVLPERRARQVVRQDFERFDLILPMTRGHETILQRVVPQGATARIERFLNYAPELGLQDVPDPWYGTVKDYEHAFDLIEAGIDGLLRELMRGTPARG
ncbi:MAG: low molecular weight protein-tyrosine-phosphatase [Geminicoccaceae bacterium]